MYPNLTACDPKATRAHDLPPPGPPTIKPKSPCPNPPANNLLIKGALGGRTMHDKVGLEVLSAMEVDTMSVGSHYTFKPGRIVKENHVILGADSAPIFNKDS